MDISLFTFRKQKRPCPFTRKNCLKEHCPLWVELFNDKKEKVGNCTFVWNVTILIETRLAIEKLTAAQLEHSNES